MSNARADGRDLGLSNVSVCTILVELPFPDDPASPILYIGEGGAGSATLPIGTRITGGVFGVPLPIGAWAPGTAGGGSVN